METINNWSLIFLGNALWQALVIVVAALVCDRLMRNATARQRHFLWVAALALCLLIPPLGASGLLRGEEHPSVASNVIATEVNSGGLASNPPSSPALSDFFSVRLWTRYAPPILAMLALACYWLSLLIQLLVIIFAEVTRRGRKGAQRKPSFDRSLRTFASSAVEPFVLMLRGLI